MRFIRKTSRGLETRTQSYVDPTGRTITTVGAMHVATPDSWRNLVEYLTSAEENGAVIHLEGVQPVTSEKLTEDDERGINVITTLIALGRSVSQLTGLQYQKDALANAPKWAVHDVTIIDIVRGMDKKILDFLAKIPLDTISISPKRAVWSLRNISNVRVVGFFVPMVRHVLSALIDSRNVFAINAALKEDSDVVLFWGAAHLGGMHRLLLNAGFKPSRTEWRVVIPASYKAPSEEPKVSLVTTEA